MNDTQKDDFKKRLKKYEIRNYILSGTYPVYKYYKTVDKENILLNNYEENELLRNLKKL